MWEKYPPVTIRKGLIAYFRYPIGCGTMFIQKYINLYYNKILQKCVANAIQISRLFLGDKVEETLRVSVCRQKSDLYG